MTGVPDLAGAYIKRVPTKRRLFAEAAALGAFGADRAAAIIDMRPDRGELVLERITPGVPLALTATEDEAMQVVATLFADGWPPAPNDAAALDPLHLFARALDARDPRLARASALLCELVSEETAAAVLHGDLHYDNVLSSNRAGWLLIDPVGVIGPPAFDVGYVVSRPLPSARDRLPLARAIDRRLGFLPDALGLDRQRVAAYAYVAAALSLAWAVEDGDSSVAAFAESMCLLDRNV